MTLGYTYIECPVGHLLHHDVHRTTTWHGGCHSNYLWILFGQFQQCVTEYILIFLWLCGIVVHNTFTSIGVEFSGSVPCGHIFLCRCITMSFLGVQVQQFWSCHFLQLTKYSYQLLHVVSVKGTKVLDVHAIEYVLLVRYGTLHGVCQSYQSLLAVIVHHAVAVKPACSLKLESVVMLVGAQI